MRDPNFDDTIGGPGPGPSPVPAGDPPPVTDPDAHYDNLEVLDPPCRRETKLKFLLNPCDIDRHPRLAPIGDWLASWASHCPCCNSARVLIAGALGLGAGLVVAWL